MVYYSVHDFTPNTALVIAIPHKSGNSRKIVCTTQDYPILKAIMLENYSFKNHHMDSLSGKERNVKPDIVIKILENHGTKITLEEAKIMLDFLYKFGKLTLESVLKR